MLQVTVMDKIPTVWCLGSPLFFMVKGHKNVYLVAWRGGKGLYIQGFGAYS